MKLIKKVGYITRENLGADNVMLNSNLGPFLMKISDYREKRTEIDIYPIVQDTSKTGLVPVFRVRFSEEDYKEFDNR